MSITATKGLGLSAAVMCTLIGCGSEAGTPSDGVSGTSHEETTSATSQALLGSDFVNGGVDSCGRVWKVYPALSQCSSRNKIIVEFHPNGSNAGSFVSRTDVQNFNNNGFTSYIIVAITACAGNNWNPPTDFNNVVPIVNTVRSYAAAGSLVRAMGFSDGGGMASYFGRYASYPGQIMKVGCQSTKCNYATGQANIPLFFAHGHGDTQIPPDLIHTHINAHLAAGYPVLDHYSSPNGGHQVYPGVGASWGSAFASAY